MPSRRSPLALLVAAMGIVASFSLIGVAWSGIRLIMVEGLPLQWTQYFLLTAGAIACLTIAIVCIRLLDRWGIRPSDQ